MAKGNDIPNTRTELTPQHSDESRKVKRIHDTFKSDST